MATKPKLAKHNTRDKQKKVYAISEGHALVLVARVVVGFVLEVGFVFVFEAGALVAALAALAAAALAAGYWDRLAVTTLREAYTYLLSLRLLA